ncbi:unnamed protein product [Calicophoron daubneyi]|uniref:GDP/GTP exchange factor Sec2 N-terminal domain-containing protein n=1 Tax=Calicophoron daubneyi TaxID=300641 RepID=A0AAV2T6G6_CALDB
MSVNNTPNGCDQRDGMKTIKSALEENTQLKSYIHDMNSECLELQATLFEEANKMVNEARKQQSLAERRAEERSQENKMLRSQVEALRGVINSLPSPVPLSKSRSSLVQPPTLRNPKTRTRRPKAYRQSTPALFRKSCENLTLLSTSEDAEDLTAVSRSALLDALLANEDEGNELDHPTFQGFLEWIKVGCPLKLPSTLRFDLETQPAEIDHQSETLSRIMIVRCAAKDDDDDLETIDEKETTYIDYKPRLDHRGQVPLSHTYTTASTMRSSSGAGVLFIQRLYEDDIRPCLEFKSPQLLRAIYHSLPSLQLEMIPLLKCNRMSSDNNSENCNMSYCPLMPPHEPTYQLTVKNLPNPDGSDPNPEHLVARISTPARNRIAAVVNLFQYLSLISRGVVSISRNGSTPALPENGGKDSDQFSDSGDMRTNLTDFSALEKQFWKIQRIRLTLAFARLGFGMPEMD